MGRLEYHQQLYHERIEVGPISPQDMLRVLEGIPQSETTSLGATFLAREHIIPGSKGEIYFHDGKVQIEKIMGFGDGANTNLEEVLAGGKIETLTLSLPKYEEGEAGLWTAGERLLLFQGEPLKALANQGYEVQSEGFRAGQFLYETGGSARKFFAKSIAGKIVVTTEPTIIGKPERKLVLSYTPDIKETREFKVYEQLLDEIRG